MKSGSFFFLFIFVSAFCTAQNFDENEFRFYSGISAGYSFGILKTKVGELNSIDYDCVDDPNDLIENPLIVTDVMGSYGKGWNDAAFIGYRITKTFGAEVSLNYLEGRKFRNNNLFDGITTKRNYVGTRLFELSLNPRLLIHFYYHNRWNLYAMAGPRFAVWNQYQTVWVTKEHCILPDSMYNYDSYHTSARIETGVTAAIRINFSLSKSISVLAEGDFVLQDFEFASDRHFPVFELPYSASSIGFRIGLIYNMRPR